MKIARFIFRLFGINTYVVWDPSTGKAAVIDPGMSSEDEEKALQAFIEREKLEVSILINTHLHIDHACGNGFVMREYGVKSAANINDKPLGESLKSQAREFMLDFEPQGTEISTFLNDGDIVEIGEGKLKVLEVPGHSPGGIALYCEEDHFLLSGDSLFEGSIGRTDLPGGSYRQLINAVHEKLMTLPPKTVVYPGHCNPTTIGAELRNNPFLKG